MKLDELAFLTLGVSAIFGAIMSLLPSLRVCALQNATIYNCSCVCNDKFTIKSQYPKNGEYGGERMSGVPDVVLGPVYTCNIFLLIDLNEWMHEL